MLVSIAIIAWLTTSTYQVCNRAEPSFVSEKGTQQTGSDSLIGLPNGSYDRRYAQETDSDSDDKVNDAGEKEEADDEDTSIERTWSVVQFAMVNCTQTKGDSESVSAWMDWS